MAHDAIVDEVRAIREELAARFNFDIHKIVEDAQRRQANSASRVVSFQKPNPAPPPTGNVISVAPTPIIPPPAPAAEL